MWLRGRKKKSIVDRMASSKRVYYDKLCIWWWNVCFVTDTQLLNSKLLQWRQSKSPWSLKNIFIHFIFRLQYNTTMQNTYCRIGGCTNFGLGWKRGGVDGSIKYSREADCYFFYPRDYTEVHTPNHVILFIIFFYFGFVFLFLVVVLAVVFFCGQLLF